MTLHAWVACMLVIPTFWSSIAGSRPTLLQAEKTYAPASTTVAILPVLNMTGRGSDADMGRLLKAVGDELASQFAERGFKLMDAKAVADAVAGSSAELSDREQQKKALIRKVGASTGADLVVFATITDINSNTGGALLWSYTTGTAKLKFWVLDTKTEHALLSGRIQSGHGEALQGGPAGGQYSKVIHACILAVHDALTDALKQYPIVKDQGRKGH